MNSVEFIFCTGIPKDSFVFQQLGFENVESLIIKGSLVLNYLKELLKGFGSEIVFSIDQREANEFLSKNLIVSKDVRQIIWPARCIPKDSKKFFELIRDLAMGKISHLQLGQQEAVFRGASTVGRAHLEVYDLGANPDEFEPLVLAPPTRYFNRLVDQGIWIEKYSQEKIKGKNEYKFFTELPPSLSSFFPEAKCPRESETEFSYLVKKVRMVDVSRLLIYDALSAENWTTLFDQIQDYLLNCPRKKISADERRAILTNLFIDKLRNRLDSLLRSGTFDIQTITLIENLCVQLTEVINASTGTELVFSHGDLCFSNILYDKRTGQLTFVDPRGLDQHLGPYLPIEYDLAKLSHSIFGGYDWIVSGGTRDPSLSSTPRIVRELFLQILARFETSLSLIRAAEASLFLSMIPLHSDNPTYKKFQISAAQKALKESGSALLAN